MQSTHVWPARPGGWWAGVGGRLARGGRRGGGSAAPPARSQGPGNFDREGGKVGRGRGRLNHNACTPSAPGDGWEEGGGRREDPRHAPALTPVPTPAPAPTPPAHLPATPAPPYPGCGETPIGARGLARSQHHTTPHGPPQHGPPRHNTTRRVLRGMQVDTPRACLPFPSGPGPPARFLPPPLPPLPPRPRPRGRGRGRAPHPRLWPGTRLWGCWGG